ncbi:hypothetical protein LH51_15730 [Nitrincola sp. A-D6]|uniref:hypothetical protein n=1 Tax=Nitrincola sp. A-D6 TaxID=1545442 RepID=UPI00051FB7BF|nr:hypothetical protein [Nitrincola sp. A-D6]KGK41327.1 hypothetical protein LH51_15730 [Nitrincola sp. A-D6]
MKPVRLFNTLLALILSLVAGQSFAETDNFRFALPESYQPFGMTPHPVHHGNALVLMPAEARTPWQQQGYRNIRVLTLTESPEATGFTSTGQGVRAYAGSILNNLDSDCEQSSVHVGSPVQLRGGLGVDWRRSCRSTHAEGLFLAEQGRLFFDDKGVYGLSQFGFSSSAQASMTEAERHWFAKFVFNSNFCRSGMNCGDEGYFKYWVEYQPEVPATPE